MTKSEYQELVEFIAVRFDRSDKRFDTMDDRLRRVEILGEDNRHQIQILAESLSVVDGKVEVLRSEMNVGFQDLRDLLGSSHGELDRRVTRLEKDRPARDA